jgi:hypothetical protein
MNSIEPTESRAGRVAEQVASGVLAMTVCAVLAVGVSFVWCTFVESRPASAGPQVSYGQAFFLFTLPMSAMIGASIGVAVTCCLFRREILGVLVSVSVSAIVAAILFRLWDFRLGFDASQQVLYGPLIAETAVLFGSGLIACALMARRK